MGALRLYLALAVVAWHLTDNTLPIVVRPELAVIMFYMISGFYMSMVINAKYSKLPLLAFYRARVLRLFPIYYVVLFVSVCLIWFFGTPNFYRPWRAPVLFADWLHIIFSNLTFFDLDNVKGDQRIVSIAWTLGVEVQFYLVAPFLVTRRIIVCVAILAATLMWRLWLVHIPYDRWTYAPAEWCFFAMGAVSQRLFANIDRTYLRHAGWIAFPAIILLAYLCDLHNDLVLSYPDLDRPQYWLFYSIFALSLPAIFALTQSSAIDRYIGEISYPLYICHILAIGITWKLLPTATVPEPYDHRGDGRNSAAPVCPNAT